MEKKSKSPKVAKYFIVKFPNGSEALIRCNGWYGLTPYTPYINPQYDENTVLISVRWWEAIKYVLKGRVFNADK